MYATRTRSYLQQTNYAVLYIACLLQDSASVQLLLYSASHRTRSEQHYCRQPPAGSYTRLSINGKRVGGRWWVKSVNARQKSSLMVSLMIRNTTVTVTYPQHHDGSQPSVLLHASCLHHHYWPKVTCHHRSASTNHRRLHRSRGQSSTGQGLSLDFDFSEETGTTVRAGVRWWSSIKQLAAANQWSRTHSPEIHCCCPKRTLFQTLHSHCICCQLLTVIIVLHEQK